MLDVRMKLYLDIETNRPRKDLAFIKEKIIVIGVIEEWTKYAPESANKNRFFKLWDEEINNNEGKLVREFYEYLGNVRDQAKKQNEPIVVVGFNILRFDIPLLIQKGFKYKINSLGGLNKFWHDMLVIDYEQASLPFYSMRFKGLQLETLIGKAKAIGLNVEERYGSGEDVVKWFENKEYDKIIKHLKADLEAVRVIDQHYRRFHSTLAKEAFGVQTSRDFSE